MTVITVTVISFTPVTVGTVPKSNIKIVERGKSDTPNTHIHRGGGGGGGGGGTRRAPSLKLEKI
jgi:hypothetical protein